MQIKTYTKYPDKVEVTYSRPGYPDGTLTITKCPSNSSPNAFELDISPVLNDDEFPIWLGEPSGKALLAALKVYFGEDAK